MNRTILLALALLLAPALSAAATCRIVSGGTLAFGPYDVLASNPTDTQVDVTVTCERDGGPRKLTLVMQVDRGRNGPSVNARRLARVGGGTSTLDYGLYRNAARSNVVGMSIGVDTLSVPISVDNKSSDTARLTLFGRIPPGQDVPAGDYSDSVQVTVSY